MSSGPPIPAQAAAGQPGPVRFGAVLLTALALGLLGQAARAEVPFREALGAYAHSNPDHRNLSPIWGMIALKGHILSRIQQSGPYAATPHPRYPRHWLADRRACPQDGASALVQHLFRPGSATTVAPMEAREDPIGQIRNTAPGAGGAVSTAVRTEAQAPLPLNGRFRPSSPRARCTGWRRSRRPPWPG